MRGGGGTTARDGAPAFADSNTYPTSIAGCNAVGPPTGPSVTCDLKDSKQDLYYDPWGEENRECTSYVAWMLHSVNGFNMPWRGQNAINWGTTAASKPYNYTVNMTPEPVGLLVKLWG